MIYTILILGSKGQLGRCLIDQAKQKKINHRFITKDIDELDITKKEELERFFSEGSIDIIINCAAYTAVDKAEEEPDLAFLINETATSYLAEVALRHHCYLFHISTDYVFDGEATSPYKPDDITHPQSVYGKSKRAGEEAMIAANCDGAIIRTSWLYSQYGHNFVKTMLRIGRENTELRVVNDQYGSPTNANDLAAAILQMVELGNRNRGTEIYHFSNRGIISWYDFAKEIITLAGYETRVTPVSTAEYPTKAKRPCYSAFDLRKIELFLGYSIPSWDESLKKYFPLVDYIEK
ncbi:dTDP-4-dehydrorhamnose reductase [Bacteroidales bacterium OttesenSCG-928-B11]|nr:dTDP-4-dehydrorhamnose reductase [Bacteroidales bacterium OttesenSCG-928-E04]MDL2308811.1 dTDP-4-dehydrorhamnose reductase [Bacteroidales bacterium OttesenSCG-928-C03]MDL2312891.1 dTDP-4-dehydrorhamnose reductase [Bacteroidales bacterium OttesenSCG-928-B11]MDL2325699.1 dTDP-4-dehydrorhamnose reductase [Bacteroidales bacterium OttesenSCG-928-A14]